MTGCPLSDNTSEDLMAKFCTTFYFIYLASRQNSWNNAQGLVLAPTRELCMQIESQAKELMSGLSNMRTALIVGGMPMPNQIYRLRQGVQIVFATPGRLVEILRNTDVDFSEIQMLVIDEVDVLMQMGFENQVCGSNSWKENVVT